MRLYFDACCLNRPFDGLTQHRVRLESEAVLAIIQGAEEGRHRLIVSEVVELEIARGSDPDRRAAVLDLMRSFHEKLLINDVARREAALLIAAGLGPLDALHLAVAEQGGCDMLLTTDDDFVKRAMRSSIGSPVRVENPVRFATAEFLQ